MVAHEKYHLSKHSLDSRGLKIRPSDTLINKFPIKFSKINARIHTNTINRIIPQRKLESKAAPRISTRLTGMLIDNPVN
jgi:hypothetical protein